MAEAIRAARLRLGMTQEQLAHAAGISRNHVQLLERGIGTETNPRLTTLYALADALQVRPLALLPRDVSRRGDQ
jgi:transcriptional regulator with XRE-family HTH domain